METQGFEEGAFAFENLRVYRKALDFINEAYRLSKAFPQEEVFGLTSQFRRAATSIALNIAEGSALTRREFKNFLRRSRGSIYECASILNIARNNGSVNEADFERSHLSCKDLAKSISALINSMK